MSSEDNSDPTRFKGVMVSSTFTDLQQHRAALIRSIDKHDLKPVAMENSTARPDVDVVDSSLQMVHKASAYVGVVSHKYGQIPDCPQRNPDGLSLSELEFNEARQLGLPTLLFIMGDDHPVKAPDVETDPKKIVKLKAFRENAKRMREDSSVHRVYTVFNSLHEFEIEATRSLDDLRRELDKRDAPPPPPPGPPPQDADSHKRKLIPTPPNFYAEPPYIGSHEFIGRQTELETLDNWAAPDDEHPILLFDAIGGAGKSILTWQWVNKYATKVRDDWEGRFWYSFYERGAIMADFCGHALAYITGRPFEEFRKKKTFELGDMLLHHLAAKPWLFVLDGIERLLVAYHRIDAAQLADEDAGKTDEIARRDPCTAIRPVDDELLRTLAGAAPSKLLLTSRLVPRVLLNTSYQPISGVRHERLRGLRPPDAEELFRACGVTGNSKAIQSYLEDHCDCHPLVTGVLAGLVTGYLPDRGNFDGWVADPEGGDELDLADLDLIHKRNHILKAALAALDEKSRQLLSTLALLSESVDYPTLKALNPHEPVVTSKLHETVRNLERRGLLQYDSQTKHHDLHPVVRGIAAGGLRQGEKVQYGQRVVDHFSQKAHSPYEQAETLEDVSDGLNVVRALIQMGRHAQAFAVFRGGLAHALNYNLEAHAEKLSVVGSFFQRGWGTHPTGFRESQAMDVAASAGFSLCRSGQMEEALAARGLQLRACISTMDWHNAIGALCHISYVLTNQNRLAKSEVCIDFAFRLTALFRQSIDVFRTRLEHFRHLVEFGDWKEAESMWRLLDPMGRSWTRAAYRPGDAEHVYARFLFCKGELNDEYLDRAEHLAKGGKNRHAIRAIHRLRGESQLQQGGIEQAAESLHEAVRMAREVGQVDSDSETQLAFARMRLGQPADPRHEAERLATARQPAHNPLAELWLAIGEHEEAKKHALAAYRWAWADGEPYVHRYELDKSQKLLAQLGVELPQLPQYDPAKEEKFAWEDEVVAAIEKLKAEKKAKH